MKRLWRFGSALLAAALLAATAQGQESKEAAALPLDEALRPGALWETRAEAFVSAQEPLGFRWLSTAKGAAQTTKEGVTFLGLPVTQAVVRMKDGAVAGATLILYNRGDDGELSRADFEAAVHRASEALSAATGVKATPRGRDATSAVKAEGWLWNTPEAVYLLESSFTREDRARRTPFRAEFVRLEIAPVEKPKSLLEEAQAAKEKAAPFRGADHVVRDQASGDVYLKGIPMVDQGEKGYCVVATVERVLRYYGVRVDANELAQLAGSSASEGTSVTAMTESLKKLTARFKIRVRTLIEFDVRSFLAMIDEYNRLAKRQKQPEVSVSPGMIELKEIYAQMQPDTLRAARTKSKAAVTGFESKVKASIEKGVPLLWSIIYGVIPEGKPAQAMGGHMRLIIGCNAKTREILYSDSWGAGHELKRMPLEDAWTITTSLGTVEPF